MFLELIFTHCGQGIELATGKMFSGNDFKVYACDAAILNMKEKDLLLLDSLVSKKQPFKEPSLMDDAYLYYVPESIQPIFINFHPFKHDPNIRGDTRPGKYINQAFIGDFSEHYPCDMFGSKTIWDAKERGLEHYYVNPPHEIESRNLVTDDGKYKFENIHAFIMDGRCDALKTAVSFLIEQYNKHPADRKFLVILDGSSENIEQWITAIEYAFSPRMAASLPFATRINDFEKILYSIMIVGVDARDSKNADAARSKANSSYVLLDGQRKEALFDAEIYDPYFQLITRFDSEHRKFCREFLQMFEVKEPCSDVFELYKLYSDIKQIINVGVKEVVSTLNALDAKKPNDALYRDIYNDVNSKIYVSRSIEEDVTSALQIYSWIQSKANIIGDSKARERFSGKLCAVLVENVYKYPDNENTRAFWNNIKNSEFITDAASAITNIARNRENSHLTEQFTASEAVEFINIYFECASIVGISDEKSLQDVVSSALTVCYRDSLNKNNAIEIINTLSLNKKTNAQDVIITLSKLTDPNVAKFLIDCLMDIDGNLLSSGKATNSFCIKLHNAGLDVQIDDVLIRRLKEIQSLVDLDFFINAIDTEEWVNQSQREMLQSDLFKEQAHKIIEQFIKTNIGIFSSNDKTRKLCEWLHKKNFDIMIDEVLSRRLRVIKKIEDIEQFIEILTLATINKSEREKLDKALYDQMKLIIFLAMNEDKELFMSNEKTKEFCHKLHEMNFDESINDVLVRRLDNIKTNKELAQFIKIFQEMYWMEKSEQINLFEMVDSKIYLHEKDAEIVAENILNAAATQNIKCVNSIHVYYVIKAITDNGKSENLMTHLDYAREQGFPSLTDEMYVEKIIELLLKTKLNNYEQLYVLTLFLKAENQKYFETYLDYLIKYAEKYTDYWRGLLDFAIDQNLTKSDTDFIRESIYQVFFSGNHSEKEMNKRLKILTDKTHIEYFNEIIGDILENRPKSFIRKMFSVFTSGSNKIIVIIM